MPEVKAELTEAEIVAFCLECSIEELPHWLIAQHFAELAMRDPSQEGSNV